jgi:hypothetical protein
LIVQLRPAARLEGLKGQVLVWEKFALTAMLEIVSGTMPVFVRMAG